MKPHLVRWHKDYGAKGLTIIDVDNGQHDTMEDVREDARKKELPYPILWDRDGKTFSAYGIRATPVAYLIAADGKVVWEGAPLSKVEEIEKRIAAEVAKIPKKD